MLINYMNSDATHKTVYFLDILFNNSFNNIPQKSPFYSLRLFSVK